VALQAEADGVPQITVPYLPTARNQPALDFLESIETGEKQEAGDGALFVYPVTELTDLSYQPTFNEEIKDGAEQAATTDTETQSIVKPASSERTQQIAAQLNRVEQIQQAVTLNARRQRPESAQPYTPPESETEQVLAAIWETLLGLEQVSIHDNFFELGGHSLLATQLLSRIRSEFGVELSLRQMFEAPTISGLALVIIQAKAEQVDHDKLEDMLSQLENLSVDEIEALFNNDD
jgi:acyl carrier protein